MVKIKWIYRFLESVAYSIWGLSLIDLFATMGLWNLEPFNFLKNVDKTITTLTVSAGLVGLIIKSHHAWGMNKRIRRAKDIETQIREEELRAIRYENNKKLNNEK